jgi:hypothetical protein
LLNCCCSQVPCGDLLLYWTSSLSVVCQKHLQQLHWQHVLYALYYGQCYSPAGQH